MEEAIVYCASKGFSEEYMLDLDVEGFGKVYKYLKRIEAREKISMAGLLRTSANANKKEYSAFLDVIDAWLPRVERNSVASKGSQAEFEGLVGSGKLR